MFHEVSVLPFSKSPEKIGMLRNNLILLYVDAEQHSSLNFCILADQLFFALVPI